MKHEDDSLASTLPDTSRISSSSQPDEGRPIWLLRGSILGLEAIRSLSQQIREVSSLEEAAALAAEIDGEVSSLIERHEKRIGVLTSEQRGEQIA